ncbi:alpha/beta hydrolase-fold protein [uncultured Sphingomonas sp.]|uniref:alpha/beta hydrolase-fold protein n=1 Tax=uncultured Sphingomonas sp. TaxID=158754 RepID=UPI0035CA4E25
MFRPLTLLAAIMLLGAATPAPEHEPVTIAVTAAPALGAHLGGRLIVFVERVEPGAKPAAAVDFSPFRPTGATIAAREVTDLQPGRVAMIDAETDAWPAPLSTLAAGTYRVQAVLDRNHDYDYAGRGAGDLVSRVVEVTLPGRAPPVVLDTVVPTPDPAARLARLPAPMRGRLLANLDKVKAVEIPSAALTAFVGRPMSIRGWIALPPGYDGTRRFPTVYSDGGFGSTLASAKFSAAAMSATMAEGAAPPMIWVFLDHSGATGTNEFADSANNGPWGAALTTEVIPTLERLYAMDATVRGRFLTGHSSGGWSCLWLQVRYPRVFGGSWPTSPDPGDFHDFTNINLYADANFYYDADGKPRPLVRDKGKVIATMEQFARAEAVLGQYGGQIASFEWVFSPRGADGRPVSLFDRATGAIDPAVAAYWRDHYDIAWIIARDAATLKPDLDGKVHLTVGTADTFYLDGPAHLLQAAMAKAGIRADFTYLPGKTHMDLFVRGTDSQALLKDIAWAMYGVARPGAKRPRG